MSAEYRWQGRTLRVETDMVEITSGLPRPDQSWTYTDRQGHEHFWRDGWPTLRWVEDEPTADDDGDGHWECAACGEQIEPGIAPAGAVREFVPGLTSACIDGEPVSEAEAQAFIAAAEGDTEPCPNCRARAAMVFPPGSYRGDPDCPVCGGTHQVPCEHVDPEPRPQDGGEQ